VVGGIFYKLQVAHMKLCASRAFWLVAYPSQGHEMLFDAHTRAFMALGGSPAGHLRQHEDGGGQGQEGQGPCRQCTLCRHVRALPVRCDFCNVASGWEKGVVEKNVQDSRGASGSMPEDPVWQRLPSSTPGWASAAALCGASCAIRSSRRSACWRCWSKSAGDDAHAQPFDGYVEKPARVSSTCLVSVARNRYSVPCELANQKVSTRLYPNGWMWPRETHRGQPRAAADRGHIRYDWQHYIALVQRKPGALRNGAPFADLPAPLQRLRQG
jgi:hypothetical protein